MYFTQLCIIDTSVLKFLRREIFFQSIHYDQIGIFRVLSWGVACAQPPGGGEKKIQKKQKKPITYPVRQHGIIVSTGSQ